MPYDITALDSNSATCTTALGIEVTYRIANLTERVVQQLTVLADEHNQDMEANLRALTGVIHRLVIRWDLTDHGVPVPLTRAAIADVPAEIRSDVLVAIVEDSHMGEADGMPSPPPSRATHAPASGSSSAKRASKASRKR